MQISVRTMAFTIVLLFMGSLMAGLTSEYNGIEPEILEEETSNKYGKRRITF